VAELGHHPANLTVLPLRQDELEDGGIPFSTNRSDMLGADLPLGQPDPFGQLGQNLAVGLPRDDGAVDFLHAVLGVCEPIGELPVVGQEHQPGAHLVEPANRINPLGDLREQVDDPRASRGILIGRDVPLGLIDRVVDHPFEVDPLAIDRDLRTAGVNLAAELADDLTVHGDAALENHFLARAARANAGVRQHFLQPFHAAGSGLGRLSRPTRGLRRSRSWRAAGPLSMDRLLSFPPRGAAVGHDDFILSCVKRVDQAVRRPIDSAQRSRKSFPVEEDSSWERFDSIGAPRPERARSEALTNTSPIPNVFSTKRPGAQEVVSDRDSCVLSPAQKNTNARGRSSDPDHIPRNEWLSIASPKRAVPLQGF
jgi:hypothetical protein